MSSFFLLKKIREKTQSGFIEFDRGLLWSFATMFGCKGPNGQTQTTHDTQLLSSPDSLGIIEPNICVHTVLGKKQSAILKFLNVFTFQTWIFITFLLKPLWRHTGQLFKNIIEQNFQPIRIKFYSWIYPNGPLGSVTHFTRSLKEINMEAHTDLSRLRIKSMFETP